MYSCGISVVRSGPTQDERDRQKQEEMKKNRMISDDQYRLMKRKFGIK